MSRKRIIQINGAALAVIASYALYSSIQEQIGPVLTDLIFPQLCITAIAIGFSFGVVANYIIKNI